MKNNKKQLIKGTFLLTLTGFLTKLIGFYYRIFLSKQIGAEGVGIYQLIFPVYIICFSICCSGLQTSISRLCAAFHAEPRNAGRVLHFGLFISLVLTIPITLFCYWKADFLALEILGDARCASFIRILVFSVPPACIHACISGYYYGLKQTVIPSVAQLCEQIARVAGVCLLFEISSDNSYEQRIALAVWGLVIGECVSALISLTSYLGGIHHVKHTVGTTLRYRIVFRHLMGQAVPLTMNRVFTNLFQSAEAILIPSMLRLYGLSMPHSLAVYGILTGMALPAGYSTGKIQGSVSGRRIHSSLGRRRT